MDASSTTKESAVSVVARSESNRVICRNCGQPADEEICPSCADRIRAESLAQMIEEAPKARAKPGRMRAKARSVAGD